MNEGAFEKIGESSEPMYGPRALLVCGFTPAEQATLVALLDTLELSEVPVIFATDAVAGKRLCEVLTLPGQTGRDMDSDLDSTVLLSGMTEKELQQLLAGYKGTGLPQPLWATLTPFSENWTLSALLEELKKERIALQQRQ